jgi:Xaa-Pro aminopeptidase
MSRSIHHQRLQQLREKLPALKADAILISSPHNRRWLSGFTGSAGWILITEGRAILATDFRYWEQATDQAPAYELFKTTSADSYLDLIKDAGVNNVVLESHHVSLKDFFTLRSIDQIDWIPVNGLVEGLRVIKDEGELGKIRAATAITDKAMDYVRHLVTVGMTELELAWELEKMMRDSGATGLTFPVHVASGPNAALPHHAPGKRQIMHGDIVLVDMGAAVDGYGSDLTRTYLFADAFDATFKERYELVLNAHDAAIAAMSAGRTGSEIDAVARNMISDAGYGDYFGHGLGHGLGLEGHEDPRLSHTRGEAPLAAGMIVTVEPGVYLPGWGGIRIEDLVVVTDSGVELLSKCPHDPLIG